ncbi:MAG: flagellar basal body-associated FliL family protein [Kangiellaceae bacterium]|jgi:flagellar FliL protein|nr:flagellar basal body-associated FliL family protein [Kangiellaceae bacterium]
MADESQDLELDVEGGGSKTKLFLIIGAAVALLGGAAAFFFLSGDDDSAGDSAETSEEVEEIKEPAIYVGVPEAIISAIKGNKKDRMVQIKMSFLVRGAEAEEAVKKHMPRLKNDLLLLVGQQIADDIITPDGRNTLQEKALTVVQETMTQLESKPMIEKVLFVSFVMQ